MTSLRRPFLLPPLLAFCLVVSAIAPARAVTDRTKSYTAVEVEQAPPATLDFSVDPWTRAMPLDGFETVTTRTPATRFPTTVRLLLDKDKLYVGIHSVQRGASITATQTTNNVGFGLDDFVGVGIDTTGNGQTYYFETTPTGVRYQQSTESVKFNPLWNATARTRDGDWDAVLVVPINVLRTQNTPVQRWRMNFVRHIAANNENESWAYDSLMTDAAGNGAFPLLTDARFWPAVDGVHVASRANRPKPRAEFYGLESLGHDRDRYQLATGAFAPQGTRNLGFDLNVPLTGTIAFVGALAPDFSNVEIDQQTISPQEFRRNLTEYRPFFSQGATFFQPAATVGINAGPNLIFYSPGIGPFDRGTKIEGTYGSQSIGLLNVAGAGFNDTAIAFKHALGDRTFSYSFDAVSAHHAAGNRTTASYGASDVTYDATIDGRNLHTGLVYSADYGAERGSVPGTMPRLAYKSENFLDVHKQNYEIFTEYRDIGPKWNPVDGFTNVSDIRGPGMYVDLNGNPPAKSPLKRAEIFIFGDRLVDRSGAAHQADFNINVDLVLKNLLHLSGGPSFSALRLYDNGLALVGYDNGYRNGVTVPFNAHAFNVGYKEGTPTPYNFTTSWGPFTTFNSDGTIRPTYLRQYTLSTSRPLGTKYTLGLEFDGTLEAFPTSNPAVRARDGQELRRISVGEALGPESNVAISLRSISGNGGFGVPGLNLAASFHRRFGNASELFVNYGTPAANATVERIIAKYVWRLGSGAGT